MNIHMWVGLLCGMVPGVCYLTVIKLQHRKQDRERREAHVEAVRRARNK